MNELVKSDVAHEESSDAAVAGLLDDVVSFVRRYVVLSDAQAAAVALWLAHTHAIGAAEATPYLQVFSPEKRSGKSRLLEVIEVLAARPLATVNISEAALFRSITASQPTLLFDEYDAIFGPRAKDQENLRALLNAGHRRGTPVYRVIGDGHDVHAFPVFCAKALAGIGRLPDTVADRCIAIELRRKARHEHVERFRRRDIEDEAQLLHSRLEAFASANLETLMSARPDIPDALDDRAADGWDPLLAIADLAGAPWVRRARDVAVELSLGAAREDDSRGVQLLADVRGVFDRRATNRLFTADLVRELAADDESQWHDWWDHREGALSRGAARELAKLLEPYRVSSRNMRIGPTQAKGYERRDFEDAWSRYLPRPSAQNPSHPSHADGIEDTPAEGLQPDQDGGSLVPRGEALLALLERHRPELIGRYDMLTLTELRTIAAVDALVEKAELRHSQRANDGPTR
jgi:hypothetical protein